MSYNSKQPQDYRVIVQQDMPEPLINIFGPVTGRNLLERSVKQLEGYAVDVYASDVNHAGGVHYNSKVAERCMSNVPRLRSATALQARNALMQLIDQGTDPLHVYCQGAHAAGLDYMARLRMNDLHDMLGYRMHLDKPSPAPKRDAPEFCYYTSKWRRDNAELLIGDPSDDTPEGSYEYWQRGAPNYAFGQVRQYIMDMAQELAHGYDIDVLELDFIRAPFYFARLERYAQRHVLTEVVRRISKHCAEAGKRRGRPLRLSARVPDCIDLSLRSGLDVQQWLTEGLLEMVTISGGYNVFATPWSDIASIACKAGAAPLACLNNSQFAKDRRKIRAAALRAYQQGVGGFQLWNFYYCMDYYHPPGQNPLDFSFTADISDPELLRRQAKAYSASRSLDPYDYVGSKYDHVTVSGQVPLIVGCATDGIGHTVELDIADDPADHPADSSWKLTLELLDLGPQDKVTFSFNGQPVTAETSGWRGYVNSDRQQFEFVLPTKVCHRGINQIGIVLTDRDSCLDPFVTLTSVTLEVPELNT